MKKFVLLMALFSIAALSGFAQTGTVLDGAYVKEHTALRRVVPYAYLREADVMWSKRIWRVIDINEKINLPLKYPASKSVRDRKSLIDLLMDAVEEGTLTAYNPVGEAGTPDDEFTLPMTQDELKKVGGSHTDTIQKARPDPPYDTYDTTITITFSRDNVMGYRLKEDWFFDKQRSVIEPRIIGIAPMIYAVNEKGERREGNLQQPLFWVYYLEARKLLANAEVFNRENDAERRSFEDIFEKRMFSSYIIKESNVYDRNISAYVQGLNALLESDRIKDDIINMEHDLWEY